MQAKVGDLLVVESKAAEAHRQECEILEVQGARRPAVPRQVAGRPPGPRLPGPDAHIRSNA